MSQVLSNNELESMEICAVACVKTRNSPKKRLRYWVKDWLLKRNEFSHTSFINELKRHPGDLFNYLRMDEDKFRELLALITPYI